VVPAAGAARKSECEHSCHDISPGSGAGVTECPDSHAVASTVGNETILHICDLRHKGEREPGEPLGSVGAPVTLSSRSRLRLVARRPAPAWRCSTGAGP